MENGWNLFNNSGGDRRGQNDNFSNNNHAWGLWELGGNASSRVDNWNNNSFSQDIAAATSTTMHRQESEMHALMSSSHHQGANNNVYDQPAGLSSSSSPFSSSLFAGGGGGGGGGLCYFPDPHLTSLKLGKRHYFENATNNPTIDQEPPQTAAVFAGIVTKRGKQLAYYEQNGGFSGGPSTSVSVTVPRCQVEGCSVVLVNGKEYHRRHKVCEKHSKSPKVLLRGVEQRFCQQCSRFHVLSEFDDSKRSCRRRLAGHNERRRKSSQDHSAPRNLIQDDRLMASRYPPYLPLNSGSSALSLLSSKNNSSWMSSHDLSAQCSEALRELIAENRASSILSRQLIVDRNSHWRPHPPPINDPNHQLQNRSNSFESGCLQPSWENGNAGTHLTLDLKQTPSAAFGYLSVQGKSKEECSELWGAFKGTRVL